MKSVQLEVSLKPFLGLDHVGTRVACDSALRQWSQLLDRTDTVAILLWASDGSEILDYSGDLDATFEWARFIGNANAHVHPVIPADPEGKSLHARAYLYRPEATAPLTYRRLAEIARSWREAVAALGKTPRVGLAFDPGGEFAPSSFKYERHREICLSDTMGKASFACCYGILDSDTRRYAGYPDGIPQGTGLGAFLGCQFRHLSGDVGLDYLWLSNGFGFGMETWKTVGPLFDGRRFAPEKAAATRERILDFWRSFRRECPDLGLATRGTNLGTGTDLASDATPLREIYEGGFNIEPPPNSPWAALNGDFGLELAGYMGRIAELPPGRQALFRYYIHDPWWLNSPWLDRYERQPHDIFLPLAVGRATTEGLIEPAQSLALLSIDDSHGNMPEAVPTEVSPHLLRAWDERPDAAGPLVWLYPFDEIHDAMFGPAPAPERLFHADWFVREALNDGLPLNTVVSTRAWRALGPRVAEVFSGRVIVTPAPFDEAGEDLLLAWAETGGRLLVYGPLDRAPRVRERLGLRTAVPLEGEIKIMCRLPTIDTIPCAEPASYRHQSVLCAGGLGEIAAPHGRPLVEGRAGNEVRVLAASCDTLGGGYVDWLRAPLPMFFSPEEHLPQRDDPALTFPVASLARRLLTRRGWHLGFTAALHAQRRPVLTWHRHANGWFFSAYMPDTTVELALRTPFGTPLLLGQETWLRSGTSTYRLPRASRLECRVFVEQADGWLRHTEELPGQIGVTRRLWVHGLKHATVRFFPPADSGPVTCFLNPSWPYVDGETMPLRPVATPHGPMLETTAPITGTALLSW